MKIYGQSDRRRAFSFEGGNTEIQLGNTPTRRPENKLFRVELAEPGMVAIQLSAERLTDANSRSRPIADVRWQTGAAAHKATVDIGIGRSGSSLVVAAAQIVEVTARMSTESIIGGGGALFTTSGAYRIAGSAGPAAALGPKPAYFTQELTIPAAGAASSAVSVPQWAKRFWLFTNTANRLTSTSCTFRDPSGATNLVEHAWQPEQPFRVPGNCSQFVAQCVAGSYDATILWELDL